MCLCRVWQQKRAGQERQGNKGVSILHNLKTKEWGVGFGEPGGLKFWEPIKRLLGALGAKQARRLLFL